MISSTDRILPRKDTTQDSMNEEEDAEEEPEVKVMEEMSEFEDMMVWGHESLPNDEQDPYVRGMEEWIQFSQQVCSFPIWL